VGGGGGGAKKPNSLSHLSLSLTLFTQKFLQRWVDYGHISSPGFDILKTVINV